MATATATTTVKEIKIVEVSLPKNFLFMALQGLIGLDAAYHIVNGLGITSSLFGVGNQIIAMSGAINPYSIGWGLIMLIVSVLVFKNAKTK